MQFLLETDRLILRQFTPEDAGQVSRNSKQPIVAHYLTDMVFETEADALGWINWINNDKFDVSIPNIVVAVVEKSTEICVGLIGVAPKYELQNQVEILYAVSDAYQNRGYTTEAGHALIDWVFANTALTALVAIVKPDNVPSNRVVEKLGFQYENDIEIDYDGEMTWFHFYSLKP